jgi:hypothetical protein
MLGAQEDLLSHPQILPEARIDQFPQVCACKAFEEGRLFSDPKSLLAQGLASLILAFERVEQNLARRQFFK